jgi:hypothetical protein
MPVAHRVSDIEISGEVAFPPFIKGFLMDVYGEFYDGWLRTGNNGGLAHVLLDQQMYSTNKCSTKVGKVKLPIKEENKP